MSSEGSITWEYLKNIADTLDSYRVRALIDAKKDILDAGIYSEDQYFSILFKMVDEELLKYSLFEFLKSKSDVNLETLKQYSQKILFWLGNLYRSKTQTLLALRRNRSFPRSDQSFN